jgi:DNA-directed RNA polymerase specialized sigma24 family protein
LGDKAKNRGPKGEEATDREAKAQLAHRRLLAGWVAREIMPHEARIRAWFGRARLSPEDVDDLMQEAYCRIAMLDAVDHITSPHAYFFSVARNLLLRRLRRQQIVPLEAISEIESYRDEDTPSPERCRRVIELRKIEGWSQKQIAEHLGITEKAVEKQVWAGVRAVRQAWALAEVPSDEPPVPAKREIGRR